MDALDQAHNTHPALQPTDFRRSPSVTIVLAEEDKIDPSGLSHQGYGKKERNDLIVFPHRYRRYRTGVRKKSKNSMIQKPIAPRCAGPHDYGNRSKTLRGVSPTNCWVITLPRLQFSSTYWTCSITEYRQYEEIFEKIITPISGSLQIQDTDTVYCSTKVFLSCLPKCSTVCIFFRRFFPWRASIYLFKPLYWPRVYQVTQLVANRRRSLPKIRRNRASSPQGSSSNGWCLFSCHHGPIIMRLSFSHTLYRHIMWTYMCSRKIWMMQQVSVLLLPRSQLLGYVLLYNKQYTRTRGLL